VTQIAQNVTLGILAQDATAPVKQLAGLLASPSDEAKRLHDALSHSPILGEFEQVLAVAVLSQAVLGLAERQGEIMERVEALEGESPTSVEGHK